MNTLNQVGDSWCVELHYTCLQSGGISEGVISIGSESGNTNVDMTVHSKSTEYNPATDSVTESGYQGALPSTVGLASTHLTGSLTAQPLFNGSVRNRS